MRAILIPISLSVAIVSADVSGQIAVQLGMARDSYLLYESIPVMLNIRNVSGRTLQLEGDDERSWVDFVVSDETGRILAAAGEREPEPALTISAGQTVSRTVDLVQLYELRERGSYRVQALISDGKLKVMSAPAKFSIVGGREIWTQTVGLPADERDQDEHRTYALLLRRDSQADMLYVGVKNEQQGLVYGMLPLGGYIAMGEPLAQVDRTGHLHVLYRSGPRLFGYAHVDSMAKIIDRALYADYLSQPRLVIDRDGVVTVLGGEKTYPPTERVIAEAEVQPPPPAPPKKQKKWWWPFGQRNTAPAKTDTTAPATSFGGR
jgi:hypothetical protein